MQKKQFTFLAALLLVSSLSFGQGGPDPAITGITFDPTTPLAGIGAPLSMSFTIGNAGTAPISGANRINQMGFGICLGKVAPANATGTPLPAGSETSALSGDLLNYFTITWVNETKCYEAIQKQGVALPAATLPTLVITVGVTAYSADATVMDIGASCNIAPSPTSNGSGNNTGNDFLSKYTRTQQNATQPVSLVSFTAQAQPQRSVLVSWQTSWERNNGRYVIERSKDLSHFEVAGEVSEVAGSSSSVNRYKFVDASPYRGTSYYRLRQVDLDGSSRTYKAEPVVIDGRYGVYPNPVSAVGFTVEVDEPSTAKLSLYNASGREISLQQSASGATSAQVVPGSSLSSGVYVLTVDERGTHRTHRLVVR